MVWLDVQDVYGQTLYFDIRRVERQRQGGRWQPSLSGICGNGIFELSVKVEPAGNGRVHLPMGLARDGEAAQLLNAVDRNALEESLLAAARVHTGSASVWHPWHGSRQTGVAEAAPIWQHMS
jgi:hypothetical protein